MIRTIIIYEGDNEPVYFVNYNDTKFYLLDEDEYFALTKGAKEYAEIVVHCEPYEWKAVTTLMRGLHTLGDYETDALGQRCALFKEYWARAKEYSKVSRDPVCKLHTTTPNAPVKALMLSPESATYADVYVYTSTDGVTKLTFQQFLIMACNKHDYDIRFAKLQNGGMTAIECADYEYLTRIIGSYNIGYKDDKILLTFRSLWHVATTEVMQI